ncbi:uncharacterized protein [Periplaneta americana]|uniref:uncharacterized protein isoform X2 n=1 Tax=Periplaneta americana TaxID=6978 RepID=UPI0037E8EA0F
MGRSIFLLYCYLLYEMTVAGEFDVTTILRYDRRGPGIFIGNRIFESPSDFTPDLITVHARNDAYGLPFLLRDGTVHDANVGIDMQPCNMHTADCSWEPSNFTITPVTGKTPLITAGKHSMIFQSDESTTPFFELKGEFEFHFSTSSGNGILGIFLTKENDNLYEEEMYYIYLRNNIDINGYNKNSFILKCKDDVSAGDAYVFPYKFGHQRYCQQVYSTEFENHYRYTFYPSWSDISCFSLLVPRTYKIRAFHGHIEVFCNNNLMFDWTDNDPLDVREISFGTMQMDGKFKIDSPAVWSLNETKGSLMSSYFYPTHEKLCVSVTYKGSNNTILAVTEVSSQDIKQDFVQMQTTEMLDGWKTAIYKAELPREKIGETTIIELTAQSPDGSELLVQRIAGCNGKGNEDVLVLKDYRYVNHLSVGCDLAIAENTEDRSLELFTTESYTAERTENDDSLEYAATTPYPEEMTTDDRTLETANTEFYYAVKPNTDENCLNDGIYSENKDECLCPKGFIGPNCQKGCGVNKYGSKCEGRCSKTAGGCKGMKLCPPKRACRCAPGLRGRYCDSECEIGTYGVDCKQQCGSCSHSHCDPYTGQCPDGCLDGFYPPYCKQNYAYVSQPPTILHRGFQYLTVGADFRPETILGKGTPRFYQLQYQAEEEFVWMKREPKPMVYGNIEDNITDLKHATSYQVRIVLLDVDGGSYQGEKVPVVTDKTECTVPDKSQYELHTVNSTHDGFQVAWNYTNEDPLSCPMLNFELELYEDWGWTQKFEGSTTSTTFTGLLPGHQYELRVRVITSGGEAPFSNVIKASTKDKDPEKVFDFRLISARFNELEVEWTPPLETAGKIETYRLSYMCRKLLACEVEDCSHSKGYVEMSGTSAVLRDLLPHAQYVLYVAAKAASWGPMSQLLAVTNMSAPAVSPDPSPSAVARRTNTSFTIQWQPPLNCSALNGYLQGYRYVLLGHNLEATTTSTSATFTDLTPHTQYTVWVSVVTSGGWSPNYHLLISADTRATVPGPVQNLTVYETSRRRLGVRWSAPKYTFGALKSFTVSYSSDSSRTVSSTIDPSPCVLWPQLYCHTITRLQPDKEYTILVQARNDEIEEDGETAVVTAVTKETAPQAPSYIRVARQTQTSLAVEWGLPDLLNGRLKSFVVNMQETDSLNSSECCQFFPIQEVLVGTDQTNFSYEVSDLHPASSYMISVTAKTVSLGPAVSITVHTRPPVPPMDGLIEISSPVTSSPTVKILPATSNKDLISGYLVLVLPLSSGAKSFDTVIWKDWLSDELKRLVNGSFYIAADFNQVDLEEKDDFVLGSGSPVTAGKWSEIRDPSLEPGESYQLGLVLISEYCGVHSVGYTETPAFVVQSET